MLFFTDNFVPNFGEWRSGGEITCNEAYQLLKEQGGINAIEQDELQSIFSDLINEWRSREIARNEAWRLAKVRGGINALPGRLFDPILIGHLSSLKPGDEVVVLQKRGESLSFDIFFMRQ